MAPGNVVILDNGGDTIKCGLSSAAKAPPRVVPNCIIKTKGEKKPYVADLVANITDQSALFYRRPIDRGVICNFDLQKDIWDRVLGKAVLDVKPSEAGLVLTVMPFCPRDVQRSLYDLVFEDYGFQSLCCVNPSAMGWLGLRAEDPKSELASASAGVVVDSGYSYTHITPIVDDHAVNHATMRINVGGKALTNHLKQLISYRAWNMMDETYVVNEIKEKVCYVSSDFMGDMKKTALPDGENPIRREYVLPDYSSIMTGFVKDASDPTQPEVKSKKRKGADKEGAVEGDDQQTLVVNNERISVPEVLFHPSDIGIDQMGVAEALVACIGKVPAELRPLMYRNIVLQGGNALLPGFKERLESEVRCLAPDTIDVVVHMSAAPTTVVYQGTQAFTKHADYSKNTVTKAEYAEGGMEVCEAKFANGLLGY